MSFNEKIISISPSTANRCQRQFNSDSLNCCGALASFQRPWSDIRPARLPLRMPLDKCSPGIMH